MHFKSGKSQKRIFKKIVCICKNKISFNEEKFVVISEIWTVNYLNISTSIICEDNKHKPRKIALNSFRGMRTSSDRWLSIYHQMPSTYFGFQIVAVKENLLISC